MYRASPGIYESKRQYVLVMTRGLVNCRRDVSVAFGGARPLWLVSGRIAATRARRALQRRSVPGRRRTCRAGLPATVLPAGTSRITLLPRPTSDRVPTCSPFMMLLPLPM